MDTIQRVAVRLPHLRFSLVRLTLATAALLCTVGELAAQESTRRPQNLRPRLTLRAHDGPNQTSEADLAAGQLLDSLFSPHAPSDPLSSRAVEAAGDALGVERTVAARRGGWKGRLARNPDDSDGSPPYVLVDRYGGVKRFVEPSSRVDLESYLGQTVAVRRDTGHTLLATQLALPRIERGLDNGHLELAQYGEELPPGAVIEGEGVVDGGGFVDGGFVDEGPMIVPDGIDPLYLDDGLNFGGCDACGSGVCGGQGCGFGSRPILYVRGEYLQWWFDGMDTPPLVQRFIDGDPSTVPPTPDTNLGTVFGGNEIFDDGRSGYKVLVGMWLDDYGKWGIEGDYYGFENQQIFFRDGGVGLPNPAVGRPFIRSDTGRALQLVSNPGLSGNVTVDGDSDFMMSGIRLRHNLCCVERRQPGCGDCVDCGAGVGCGGGVACGSGVGCVGGKCPLLFGSGVRRTDVLFGIRHAQLEENLRISENLTVIDTPAGFPPPTDNNNNPIPVDTRFELFDAFGTSNEFVGVDFGHLWEWEYGRWSVELLSKIALGNTRQRVFINGHTDQFAPDGTQVADREGGLLTQTTNIRELVPGSSPAVFRAVRHRERNEFSVLPELNATVGFNLTRRLRLTFGYTLVYWSRVVRPGDQIDLVVNPANIPRQGAAAAPVEPFLPQFTFRDTDFWAHGLNAGAEYRW